MTKNNESENRRIDIEEGNYNERVQGDYVQGRNNFLNNNFVLFGRKGSSEALTSAKRSRIRQNLLKLVELEIETRLNTSLHNRVYLVLEAEQNPSQIKSPWQIEVKVGSKPKVSLKDTEITKVFDQADVAGRLLILGQPGSGKTTMLLKLAENLVMRAKDNSAQSVPVLFSLPAWKNDHQNIKNWLVEQLKDKYGVRQDIGKQLVDNQEIIPLLDGLDELAAERQKKCVLKINEFLHPSTWNNPVIVCSRIQEYERYTILLELNSSVELSPFSPKQVYQYLQDTGHLKLWESISHDANLSELAKTPLLLNIIVLSAQEISIETWQQFKSSEERLSYLFDAYIRRMLKRPYQDKQPKQGNTQRWLSWLAYRLIEENTTEFLIEKMQPDWLKNRLGKFIYMFFLWGVIETMITGLIFGLIFGLSFELIWGPILGLMGGLIFGLTDRLIVNFIENKIERIIVLIDFIPNSSKTTISRLIHGLISGVISGIILALVSSFMFEIIDAGFTTLISLVSSLFYGLIFGLFYGLFYGLVGNNIQTIKSFKVSLKKSLDNLKTCLIFGLIFGLILGLILGPILGLYNGLLNNPTEENEALNALFGGLFLGLFFGLIGGLIGALISGINGLEIENNTSPNQGIRQSVINTIKVSVVTSLFAGLIIFITQVLLQKINIIQFKLNNLISADWIVPGILWGILIGISSSGIPAIKHFILRIILWSSGFIPWNYAKFLDYCTNRLILQRAGGSYRFIHDLLRQHFAKPYTKITGAPVQAIPVQPSPPRVFYHTVCIKCGHHNSANNNFCIKCGTKRN